MSESIQKSIAIINAKAPLAKPDGKEALDIALIFGSFEQKVSLFFHGDGVWQLMNNQSPSLIHVKDYLKTFAALEFYDIEHIYVCEASLSKRQLPYSFHIDNVSVLDLKTFNSTLTRHSVIYRF